MPTISMFYEIIISMYYNDHLPPHFHARYQGDEAAFTFDGEVLAGSLPHKQEALVRAWALIHSDELAAVWELAGTEGETFKIEPLRQEAHHGGYSRPAVPHHRHRGPRT